MDCGASSSELPAAWELARPGEEALLAVAFSLPQDMAIIILRGTHFIIPIL